MAEQIQEINYIEYITKACNERMQELNLTTNEDYQRVLKKELKDLDDWVPYGNINMAKRIYELKIKTIEPYQTNKSGSLILYLIGISKVDPVASNIPKDIIALTTGDCPDVDTDFDPRYRGWVKKLIVELFGEEKTCSIGSYQTYKTRACIVDVSRALGLDVQLATDITKKMSPLSKHENEEGDEEKIDDMEWDEICNIYPELKEYFELNPEVLRHCKVLRNQVKNMSKHAGGMIISNLNLQDKIPVVRGKEGLIISSWSEGQATHELSEVGLVKFDILGLSNLTVISDCIKLIEKTKGLVLKRADIPINDREAIKFGSKGDLVGIFQLESPATKPLADAVGMDSIHDLSAVTSLLRPGPKDMGMHTEYAERKHGKKYAVPECLLEILGETFGVLTYQEQCCPFDTSVMTPNGYKKLGEIVEGKGKEINEVNCVNDEGDIVVRPILEYHSNGKKELFKFSFDNGYSVTCTEDHRILTSNRGWVRAKDITPEDDVQTV